jgi:ABC-type phosphate transport system permease subunit
MSHNGTAQLSPCRRIIAPNAPMANLPIVIFQFSLSLYNDWRDLAWTGALIITLADLC